MYLLSVETSTRMGGVALLNEDRLLGEVSVYNEAHHSTILLTMIDELLKKCRLDLSRVDAFAVSTGPGSFTGLRVGIATVKGLAAAVSRPVIGIPTLRAFASRIPNTEYPICPMISARKNEVYSALYAYDPSGELTIVKPDRIISLSNLMDEIREPTHFLGDLPLKFHETHARSLLFASPLMKYPSASAVGLEALKKGCPDAGEEIEMILPEFPSVKVQANGLYL